MAAGNSHHGEPEAADHFPSFMVTAVNGRSRETLPFEATDCERPALA